ncbi:MAG TPA: metal-dependent hydrolase [Desulfobacteraceae bacterium]|nr:metal-dependent hydrolase [Desulfobacteraceae bacterium]
MSQGHIRWLGHSFVEFTTGEGHVVLFDPWTKEDGNPGASVTLEDITRADLVLVSHDHFDHTASAVAICEKTGAMLGGAVQTMAKIGESGFDKEKIGNFGMGFLIGGGLDLDWVTVRATPAFHASDSSVAIGLIVKAPDGTTIYFGGDTGIFGDMALWARLYPLDIAILPIGGIFTMDAYQASEAVKLLQPKAVMPVHYGSFPIIAKTAEEFTKLCGEKTPGVQVIAPAVGERVELA